MLASCLHRREREREEEKAERGELGREGGSKTRVGRVDTWRIP